MPGVPYCYVLSAVSADGESANSAEVATAADGQLLGTVIGTSGSYDSLGTTKELAFDGSLRNLFDGPESVSWTGLDLGEGVRSVLSRVKYAPREHLGGRMVGGKLQGSSTPDFSGDATDLFTVSDQPPDGVLTAQPVTSTKSFRYLRYVSPTGGYGHVAEVQFLGTVSGLNTPATPVDLDASRSRANEATVHWGSVAGAERYHLKRSTTSGGPHTIVASGAFTGFTDRGLSSSTSYYYVVSAVNKMGESADSSEVSLLAGQ
ncbi:MAG: fibronectin type III domain-containing protein [Polyangiaceae bacterium]|nr:fibronectin type III domain-containing protein [Polyangiaceae bacterium]